jgi:Helicase conserved C-terminal domain/Type III restriction enzyme, res subunit
MIENLILSVLRKEQTSENQSEITVPRAVRQVLNNRVAKKYNRPIIWELRQALRAKYPQSKFQSVYLSKTPYQGEYTVYYASQGIQMPFTAFCDHFGIDPQSIKTEAIEILDEDNNALKGVNQFKKNILSDVGYLPKHSLLYKKIIADYAVKCSIPMDYAETIIRPVEWVRYVNDPSKKHYKPAYLIGSHFFTPDSVNAIGELHTAKMPVYTVHNLLYPLFHLTDKKRDERLLEGKEHFILLEGQNDCNAFNYHFKDTIYFAVTVGGVKNWINAKIQLDYLKSLRPSALFFTLFDNDDAGLGTELPFATKLLWTTLFKTELKKGFDVCDAFQTFPNAKALILKELQTVRTQVENEKAFLAECEAEAPVLVKQTKRTAIRTNTYNDEVRYKSIIVDKYLDEKRNELIHNLLDAKRLLIHGHTELGKTTLFKNLSEDKRLMELLNIQHIILVTPRVMLADEMYKSSDSIHTVLARGRHFSVTDITPENKLIITNIDNIGKLTAILPKSLLIVDESHKATSDSSFRNQQNVLFDILHLAPYVIMMTATPDMNICNYLNFSYLHCSSLYRTQHKKFKVYYIPFEKNKDYLPCYLSNIAERKHQRHLVYQDSKDLLEIAAQKCTEMGLKSVIITRETCQQLVQEGLEKLEKYDVLLCTSIADAGIDLKFKIDCVHTPFHMNTRDIVQAMGRGRGVVNWTTNVFCYHSEKIPQTSDLIEKDRFFPILGDEDELIEFAKEGFWEEIAKAEQYCKGLNMILAVNGRNKDGWTKLGHTLEKTIYYSELTGKYKVNFPFCSYLATERPLSIEAHFAELQALDNCVFRGDWEPETEDSTTEVLHPTDAGIGADVKTALNAKKLSKKQLRNEAKEYIKKDLLNAILYYSQLLKDENRKNEIVDWLRTKDLDVAAGAIPPLMDEHNIKDFNDNIRTLIERFFEIRKAVKDYESTYFVEFSDANFRFELRKLVIQWRLKQPNQELSSIDATSKMNAKKLRHELHKVEQNDKLLTKDELVKMVKKVYKTVRGSEKIMYAMYGTDLIKIKDKYKIGVQWTLEDSINVLTGATQESKKTTKKEKKAEKEMEKERKKREKKAEKSAEKMEKKRKKKVLKTLKI